MVDFKKAVLFKLPMLLTMLSVMLLVLSCLSYVETAEPEMVETATVENKVAPQAEPAEAKVTVEKVSTLIIFNDTPYEIRNVFIVNVSTGTNGNDLLGDESIASYDSSGVTVPGDREMKLAAEILVNDELIKVEDINYFKTGKSYSWSIAEKIWTGNGYGSYKYLASYGYLDETYGYLNY